MNEITLKIKSECLTQFQARTLAVCKAVLFDHLAHQRLLKPLIMRPFFACFQLHPRVNSTAERKNGVQNAYKMRVKCISLHSVYSI
jgi:hypothetical protein